MRQALIEDAFAAGDLLSRERLHQRIAANPQRASAGWAPPALAVILGVVVVAIGIAILKPPVGSPHPSVIGVRIALPTQEPPPGSGTPPSCPAALIRGQLKADATEGLILIEEPDGKDRSIIWPYGYVGRLNDGRLELLDGNGAVVAREGDRVELDGGESGPPAPSPPWSVCKRIVVLEPISP